LTSEFVEFEVKRALEWLQGSYLFLVMNLGDRNESRRYAAVSVLKEMALNSATLIYSYVPQILELIWIPLRDSKVARRCSFLGFN
jgi:FKBP12-rapamycin complex-associated protein